MSSTTATSSTSSSMTALLTTGVANGASPASSPIAKAGSTSDEVELLRRRRLNKVRFGDTERSKANCAWAAVMSSTFGCDISASSTTAVRWNLATIERTFVGMVFTGVAVIIKTEKNATTRRSKTVTIVPAALTNGAVIAQPTQPDASRIAPAPEDGIGLPRLM